MPFLSLKKGQGGGLAAGDGDDVGVVGGGVGDDVVRAEVCGERHRRGEELAVDVAMAVHVVDVEGGGWEGDGECAVVGEVLRQ